MPSIIKEDIDRWYDYGLYPRTRTLYLGNLAHNDAGDDADYTADGGIYWNTSRRIIQGIHLLDGAAPTGDKPITIIMNSCGGDWSHGMAIYDAIRYAKNHITVINMSHARSMSSLIFQAADYRITAPNGYYMIHDGYMGVADSPQTVFSWADFERQHCLPAMYKVYLSRLQEQDSEGKPKVTIDIAADLINKRLPTGAERVRPSRGVTGIRLSHIQQMCSRDTFFTAEEMVQLNFADRLLETADLTGAYANPRMHGLPTGLDSLSEEED